MTLRCVFCYYDETITEAPHEAVFVVNGMSVCESAELHMEAAELAWPESLAWLRRQTGETADKPTSATMIYDNGAFRAPLQPG